MRVSLTAGYFGISESTVRRCIRGISGFGIISGERRPSEPRAWEPEAMEFLLSNGAWENQKYLIVNLSMPKFDVSGQLDLIEGLQAMGITDVFDPAVSDFTPMTTQVDEIYVSQATHAARVAVDEEGLTAAAFTVIASAGGAMPPEDEVDFTLDRPFLFVLTGAAGQPLFAGVVNQPA